MKLKAILDNIFFPDKGVCIFCGSEKNVVNAACDNCAKELKALELKPRIGSIDFLPYVSVYRYEGIAKKPIIDLKYNGAKWKSKYMATEMLEALRESGFDFDCIAYVPMTKKKQKKRGYNQAKELAVHISKRTKVPLQNMLIKAKDTETQTKLTAAQRAANIKGAFTPGEIPCGKHILLIDDVLTTGATVSECAKVLRKTGAETVRVLVYARD